MPEWKIKKKKHKPSGAKRPKKGPYSKERQEGRQKWAKSLNSPFKRAKVACAGGHSGSIKSPLRK